MKSHLPMSREERVKLRRLARSNRAPHALVQRAKAMIELRGGSGPTEVSRALGMSIRWVGKWRNRWLLSPCLEALADADRPGRPPRISTATKCEVVKIACDRPPELSFSSVWTQQGLVDELRRQTGALVSRSTVQRILSAGGLRPHRVRVWLHSPDPQFREKVERVCQLYLAPPKGSTVICVDEKPMQVLARKHPTKRQNDATVRKEFEYVRRGTCCLLAGFDVRTGEVLGHIVKRRTGPALVAFLESVAKRRPTGPVYVVWDNLNIHGDGRDKRWTTFNRRHGRRFHFVHTPLHASWVNQVEIWFSILQRRVLRHGSFAEHSALRDAVLGFIAHWNRIEAHPFRWTFSGRFDHSAPPRAAA
jgi:transposase